VPSRLVFIEISLINNTKTTKISLSGMYLSIISTVRYNYKLWYIYYYCQKLKLRYMSTRQSSKPVTKPKKTKKCHIIGIASKYNRKIVETEAESIPLTHKYMTAHLPGSVQALQQKVERLN